MGRKFTVVQDGPKVRFKMKSGEETQFNLWRIKGWTPGEGKGTSRREALGRAHELNGKIWRVKETLNGFETRQVFPQRVSQIQEGELLFEKREDAIQEISRLRELVI